MGRVRGSIVIGEVGKVVLKTIAVAGVLTIVMVAPNCAQLLKYVVPRTSRKWYYINTVVQRCIDKGLLKKKEKEGIDVRFCLDDTVKSDSTNINKKVGSDSYAARFSTN